MNAKVIDHQQAIKDMMAERFLLGELSEDERDAYEAHLFDCQVCFAQVKAGTEFVSYLKRHNVEEPVPATAGPSWRRIVGHVFRPAPVLAFVACLLAATGVYQNMTTIRMLKAPQVESRYVLTEQSRDGVKVISVSRNSRIRLAIEFQPQKEFVSYETQIVNEDGKIKLTVPFSAQPSQDTIELSLYAGDLTPGKYFMLVQAADQNGATQELARDVFRLQLQD
jgi:hypothetical protein